jgi:hypothetical protein
LEEHPATKITARAMHFRHLAVTELLEQGAPEQKVIAIAGWVGRKMIATYSRARIASKSEAVQNFSIRAATRHLNVLHRSQAR